MNAKDATNKQQARTTSERTISEIGGFKDALPIKEGLGCKLR
jgi:hypothetical protein